MASQTKSPLRKHVYRGDPLVEPPPAELATILDRHRGEADALITVLEEVQRHYGFLGRNHLQYVARELAFPLARVYGVATFYNLFRFHPPGKHQIRVCRGTACHVNHAEAILAHLCTQLGIAVDETTHDRRFTLQTVACMGACSLAPVLVVNETTYGRMTPAAAWQALADLGVEADEHAADGAPAAPEAGGRMSTIIRVGLSTCGLAAGAQAVYTALHDQIRHRRLPVTLQRTGCVGACHREPLVEVIHDGAAVLYGPVTPARVAPLLDAYFGTAAAAAC